MVGRGTRLLGLAGAVVLVVALAGCGSSGEGEKIPPEDAEAMLASAAEIRQTTASRQCDEAQAATTELRGRIGALPDETDREIVDALDQMVSRLDQELDNECAATGPTGPEEETTETTETTVEPTTPTTTTEPPPTEEPSPEEDGDDEDDEEDGGPAVQPPGQGGAPPGQAPEGPPGGGTPSGGIEEEDE